MALQELARSDQHATDDGPVHEFPPDPRVSLLQSEEADHREKGDAFASIVGEFQGELTGFVASIAGGHRAEDLVQDVFFRVWSKIGQFETRSDNALSSWIFKIARNAAFNAKRRDKHHAYDQPEIDGQPTAIANLPSPIGDPEAHLEFHEHLSVLDAVCERQRVVMIRQADGYSYKEIATMDGSTVPSVKSRLVRGRERASRLLMQAEFPETTEEQEKVVA